MKQLTSPLCVRFGLFEFNLQTGELRKQGLRVKLGQHAAKALTLLLEQPGQLRTRAEIQQHLWGAHTFVNFEQSINKVIHQVREALGDAGNSPRYIETVAGRGYRFIHVAQESIRPSRKPIPKSSSFAVLPFAIEPASREMELLSKRIVESITDNISQTSRVQVLTHNTVQHYREKGLDLELVRKGLLARVVAVGEMTKPNDELLVHVELIDAEDGIQLWGAQFNEPYAAVVAGHEKLADRICDQLRPILARYVSSGREKTKQIA